MTATVARGGEGRELATEGGFSPHLRQLLNAQETFEVRIIFREKSSQQMDACTRAVNRGEGREGGGSKDRTGTSSILDHVKNIHDLLREIRQFSAEWGGREGGR
jgi:hypothetical protein